MQFARGERVNDKQHAVVLRLLKGVINRMKDWVQSRTCEQRFIIECNVSNCAWTVHL